MMMLLCLTSATNIARYCHRLSQCNRAADLASAEGMQQVDTFAPGGQT